MKTKLMLEGCICQPRTTEGATKTSWKRGVASGGTSPTDGRRDFRLWLPEL